MLTDLYSEAQGCITMRCLPRVGMHQEIPQESGTAAGTGLQKLLYTVQHPRVPDPAPTGTLLLSLHSHGATERAQSRLQLHTSEG